MAILKVVMPNEKKVAKARKVVIPKALTHTELIPKENHFLWVEFTDELAVQITPESDHLVVEWFKTGPLYQKYDWDLDDYIEDKWYLFNTEWPNIDPFIETYPDLQDNIKDLYEIHQWYELEDGTRKYV